MTAIVYTKPGAPAPRGQRGRLPPCPCCTGAGGAEKCPFTILGRLAKSVCYIKRARLDENVGETLHDWKRQHTHCSMLGCICQVLNVTERLDGCGSATAGRTFSVMRQVKSWLRSAMSSNTLNNRLFVQYHTQATH